MLIFKDKIYMESLKIENNRGFFKREGEGWVEINKMTKEDLYDLVNWALSEDDFTMDAYDESSLQNPAHKTIYSHIYRQLTDIRDRKEEFAEEISSSYKEAYDKYCSEDDV